MINPREVEEAIRELEGSSATYNNCMKLASLYIIRDHMMQSNQYNYTNYGYYPMYQRGGRSGNNSNSSYRYYEPMRYNHQDDLMIKKQPMMRQDMMI